MSMHNDENDKKNSSNNGNKEPNMKFNFGNNRFALFFLISLILMFIFMFMINKSGPSMDIPYSVFFSYLEEGRVESVKILDSNEIHGFFKGSTSDTPSFKTNIPYYDENLMPLLRAKGVTINGGAKAVSPLRMILEFLPWIIGFLFIWFMFRQVQGGSNKEIGRAHV